MATLYEKKLLQIGQKVGTVQEEFNGRAQTMQEVAVKVASDKGPQDMILRTGSERLIEKMQVGTILKGHLFKDKDAKFPEYWRLSCKAKDNTHIVGEFGGGGSGGASGGSTRGTAAREGGQAYDQSAYTFESLVALFTACYEAANGVMGDVPDEVTQAATATLFIQATRCGLKAPGEAGTQDEAADPELEKALVAVERAKLLAQYEASNLQDADLLKMWKEAGGNEARFAINLNMATMRPEDAAPADSSDDSSLPF